MPEEVLFKSERRHSRGEIADYLRTVADRLDGDGRLTLQAGDESIDLTIPDRPTFEVKAEREVEGTETELSVEFELEWDENGDDADLAIE